MGRQGDDSTIMTGIEEVARLAGVSKATVSRALSGQGYVSALTKEKVLLAARTLDYVVSAHASSLVTGRSKNVAVVLPVVNSWYFAGIIEGIEQALHANGYDLMLYHLALDEHERSQVFEYFLVRKGVDAVIPVTMDLDQRDIDWLLSFGKPIVAIGGIIPGIPTMSIDDAAAGALATNHLISLGHRKIAHIGGIIEGERDIHVHRQRWLGYRAALEQAGIPYLASNHLVGEFTPGGAYRRAKQILGSPSNRPTAIFAGSDELAFGVLQAAHELGLQIPRDLSIVGIDDHELAETFRLTTVAQQPPDHGKYAVTMLLGKLDGSNSDALPEHTVMPSTLVVRDSTSAPTV